MSLSEHIDIPEMNASPLCLRGGIDGACTCRSDNRMAAVGDSVGCTCISQLVFNLVQQQNNSISLANVKAPLCSDAMLTHPCTRPFCDDSSDSMMPEALAQQIIGDLRLDLALDGDGCCSSDPSEREEAGFESPTPEFIPSLDDEWCGVALEDSDMGVNTCAYMMVEGGIASHDQPFEDSLPCPHHTTNTPCSSSQTPTSPTSATSGTSSSEEGTSSDRSRRRYHRRNNNPTKKREEPPRLDMAQQRAAVRAEMLQHREAYNAMMARQQQLNPEDQSIALRILCNEAHRRHVAQVLRRREEAAARGRLSSHHPDGVASPTNGAEPLQAQAHDDDVGLDSYTYTYEDNLACVAPAWRCVADCVEESLFFPSAVQARLSCMGIFRPRMTLGDLMNFDDHEEERTAIRRRQQQIIDNIRSQNMMIRDGATPNLFLATPYDYAANGSTITTGLIGIDPSSRPSHWADATAPHTYTYTYAHNDSDDQYSPTTFLSMERY